MIHDLKVLPEYYEAIERGDKNFELRKNDRNYAVNDFLNLHEWDGEYTGRTIYTMVKYIYHGTGEYGLEKGYCILGLTV